MKIVTFSALGMETLEKELAYRNAVGSRVRRHPKLFTIGEKHQDLMIKLVEAKSYSDMAKVKLYSYQLLKAQKFSFLYHGDVLVPVLNDERQFKLAMVVDMSTKSIVDHRSLTTLDDNEDDRPVYIGMSVSHHINRFFNKSVIDFYKLMINTNYDVALLFELYKDDPWIKQLQSNVKGAVFMPSFDDLSVTLESGKDIFIALKGPLDIETVKREINSYLAPISFDQLKDIPVQLLNANVEKHKYIYETQAIARDKAKIIYIDKDDIITGLKIYLKSDSIMHGDIVIPRVKGQYYSPNAMVVDLKNNLIKSARHKKWQAVYIGDAVTRHITKHMGRSVFDYYSDVIKNATQFELVFKMYYPDPFIKRYGDQMIKSMIYELPSKTLTLTFEGIPNVSISPFENNAAGDAAIQSILRKNNLDSVKTIDPSTKSNSRCTIM
jgi:hypothetical protein